MEKILVFGGAGFIGTTLCITLLDMGYYVICIDNLSTGCIENIQHIIQTTCNPKNFVFQKIDVLEISNYNMPDDIAFIFHLACPASPAKYQSDAVQTLNICFNGTQNILNLAKKNGARVIFTSTSEVYGDPHVSPQKESYWGNVNCTGIRSCYDEGKRVAESLIINYGKQYGINYGIVRIFNTYGPNMSKDDGRVVTNFIDQAVTKQPLTIYGNGLHTRSFCYITDLVQGLIKMAESNEKGPINIGNPEEITILKLADSVNRICNNTAAHTFLHLPADDPSNRCPDITLERTLLGWSPTIDIESGLLKLIKRPTTSF